MRQSEVNNVVFTFIEISILHIEEKLNITCQSYPHFDWIEPIQLCRSKCWRKTGKRKKCQNITEKYCINLWVFFLIITDKIRFLFTEVYPWKFASAGRELSIKNSMTI